jgi:hypothetical protein
MEVSMAKPRKSFNPDQPEMPDEARRRDQPLADAPATVPTADGGTAPGGLQPSEDGGVEQHPVHDSDMEDLGPEDYEELTDEVETTGIKSDS